MGLEILMIDIKRLHELEKEGKTHMTKSLDKCGWYTILLARTPNQTVMF